jgi:cytochrome c oxidase cbb3-type subunit 3
MSGNNPYPNENNTGHFWDEEQDVRELSNRPPRWYMWALYISVISVVIYAIYFPTIPWFGDHTKGVANWTAVGEMKEAQQQLDDYRAKKFATQEELIAKKSPKEILADKELTGYAVATAKTLFADNCAACHGSGGQGNTGFPVLADDDWLYGGTIETIHTTIINGRKSIMPAHEALLTEQELNTLADFVIANGKVDNGGKALFMAKGCVGCHMPTMTGLQALGGANLTDAIYRFKPNTEKGETQKDKVKNIIKYGVNQAHPQSQEAIMPAFGASKVIDESEIKKLAVYVHQLGGGK